MDWFIIRDRHKLFAKFAGIDEGRAKELLNEHGEPIIVYDGTQLGQDLENFRYVANKADIPREQWSPEAVAKRHKEVREKLADREGAESQQQPSGLPPKEKRYKNIEENDGMADLKKLFVDAVYEKAGELERQDNNPNKSSQAHVSLQVAKELEKCGWDGRSDFFFVKKDGPYESVYYKNMDENLLEDGKVILAPTVTNLFSGMSVDTFSISQNDQSTITAFINNQNATGSNIADALANWWITEVKNDRLS